MTAAQQLINEAGVNQFPTDDTKKYLHLDNLVQLQKREAFTAGATYALSTPELWREHTVGFMEWYKNTDYIPIENGKYVDAGAVLHEQTIRTEYTTDELFDIYIKTLKEK